MKQYEMFELAYTASEPRGSQVTIDLEAVFTHESETVSVKGFYAGDNTYKIRFLPMCAGEYSYTISGIVSDTGTLRADSAGHHGPVHAEGCHFRHADGARYSPFGTTVYALAHQEPQVTENTFKSLKNAPFNKVRLCLFPKHYNYNHNDPKLYPFEMGENGEWDVNRPCFPFWDSFEQKLQRLDTLGIQADLILFHSYDRWGFSHLGMEKNLIYLDYLTRRFSAFPHIWWSLANEYDLMFDLTERDWERIEGFVAENDPYHHLLSNHNCFAFWDAARPAITHASLQTRQLTRVAEWREKYNKPVIVDECCYEGDLPEFWGCISGLEMVRRFWRIVVTGGYCTHGDTFLDPGRDIVWWAKGGQLKGRSAPRIAFLREIVESLPGPIDPRNCFTAELYKKAMSPNLDKALEGTHPNYASFVRSFARMAPQEAAFFLANEFSFMGRCGDDAFLIFYDGRCCARDTLDLPENKTYSVELIDVWNMTRKVISEHVSGKTVIDLPGCENMAVLALTDQYHTL